MTGPASGPASYDPGERIRVTRDAGRGNLHVFHGAREIATIKRIFHGGGVKLEADGRTWRLVPDDRGWRAEGDPAAELRKPLVGRARLRVGELEAKVSRTEVEGVLALKLDTSGSRPVLQGEILAAPRTSDPHALVALAAAALVLDKDLAPRREAAGLNGDNVSAALRYGIGH